MKKNIHVYIIYTLIILFSGFVFGENDSADEWPAGKIGFTDKNRREGVIITYSEKKVLLNKGSLLFIKRGDARIILKIIDMEGKYIRCAVNSDDKSLEIKHAEDVFYSDKLNRNVKYADARKILAELVKLYENFILKVESTEDTLRLSEEVIKFSLTLDKLIPEIKRINSKYPELKKFDVSPPQELQHESGILRLLEPRLRDAFFKIKMYDSDVKVKKAADELHKVLKKMQNE